MAKKKSLLPNEFRDFLSLISFIGFAAIFLNFTLGDETLSQIMNPLFLVLGGLGLMVVGKVFKIRQWAKDGIQDNEVSRIFVIVFGSGSLVIGALLLMNVELGPTLIGFGGFIALASAIYIFIDYLIKNTKINR